MDPFLVLLHSVSAGLASEELTQLKFLCRDRVGKRKLERVQSGLDLFSVLMEQSELDRANTALLRFLLESLRRQDLLQRLDAFVDGAVAGADADPEQRGGPGAWPGGAWPARANPECAGGRGLRGGSVCVCGRGLAGQGLSGAVRWRGAWPGWA